MNVGIIGYGRFGQAIGSLLEYNGVKFDYAEKLEGKLLSKQADLVFLVVPVQFMRDAIKDNQQFISEDTIIVNCSKGIEEKTHLFVHEIVKEAGNYPNYYSLLGPSFASGIKKRQPTMVSLGYDTADQVEAIKKTIQTPYFTVREHSGYRALELASALKNLYAILCGYSAGLGLGANTHAQLISRALEEFTILADAMGFKNYDVKSPGVVGDLVLTCSSEQSRNFKFGFSLAKEDIETVPAQTVEGFHTSHSIKAIADKHNVRLPLALTTTSVIEGDIGGLDAFRQALARL